MARLATSFAALLLLAQVMVALFYLQAALLMWGPFVEGTLASKVGVALIVVAPIISIAGAATGLLRQNVLWPSITVAQVTLVLALAQFA